MDTNKRRKLIERLNWLEERDGRVTPDQVVADARPDDSPLHEHFTWDDTEAAHQHRLAQARSLIRVRVEIQIAPGRVINAPHFVREPDRKDQGYISIPRAKSDVDTAREVIRDEMDRLIGAIKRARAVAVAIGLEADMDEMLRQALAVVERVVEAPDSPTEEGPQPTA